MHARCGAPQVQKQLHKMQAQAHLPAQSATRAGSTPPWQQLQRAGRRTHRRHQHVAATASLAAAAEQAVPAVPEPILKGIIAAGEQWAQQAVLFPLHDEDLNPGGQAIVLGVAHWAPEQHRAVKLLVEQLQPQAVALNLPSSVGSRPAAAEASSTGTAAADEAAPVLLYPEALQLSMDLHAGLQEQQQQQQPEGRWSSPEVQALCQELRERRLQVPHRLERDLLDPDEVLGFYSPLDFVLKPRQVASAVDMFGWLPGSEHAEALQWAAAQGAEVVMMGASVRMQEAWVAGLVREWSLREADLGRQLGHEVQQVQRLVPPAHAAWDMQLAQALGSVSTEEQQVVGFKVSRACAAALLAPAAGSPAAHEAVEAQARLQPLKYQLFELQALHVAKQLKELLRSRCAARVITRPEAQRREEGAPSTGAAAPPAQGFMVLAVVGRQLLPTIHRLWADKGSPLWRGEVPRTFAPSQVESVRRPAGVVDPDVTQGGSRPVGQRPLNSEAAAAAQQQQQ